MAESYGEEGASHYAVLNVPPSSTLEEIRASYRAALLSVHPDKRGPRLEQKHETVDSARYLRVQEAWSVLRDVESRAMYDKSLRAGRKVAPNVVVGEEIVLEDMEGDVSETGHLEYWYPCRCSDFFFVAARELQDAGLGFGDESSGGADARGQQRRSMVLPCGSCSLHLRVHFWVPCP